MKSVGIEVAKASIICCVLDHIPTDPAKTAKTYKTIALKPTPKDLETLASLGDLFILEPTGAYSRIWFEYLASQDKDVRKVSPKRVTHLRRSHGIESKSDRYDALFLSLYGQLHHGDRSQFLGEHAETLRELVKTHHGLSKAAGQNTNRIYRNLSYEWPEACTTKNGTKPKQSRKFLEAEPPALYRYLAGQPVTGKARRDRELAATVGSGLSDLTQLYARHVCDLERAQYDHETQISALLDCSEFEPYKPVFDSFDFGPMTRAVILSRIHPFNRFLGEGDRPRVEHVRTDHGRSKRRVSLASFKMALGMGTVIAQSGDAFQEKPGGAGYARTALFQHCKVKVVMKPPSDLSAARRVEHRRYYEQISPNMEHRRALMKLSAKITKDLFKDLVTTL